MGFPENLKRLRKGAGISRADMAKILCMTENAYGTYERGEREPGIEKLLKIADALHVTTDELLGHEVDDYKHCKAYTEKSGRFQVKIYPKGTFGHDLIEVYDATKNQPLAGYLLTEHFINAVHKAKEDFEKNSSLLHDTTLDRRFLYDFWDYAERRAEESKASAIANTTERSADNE